MSAEQLLLVDANINIGIVKISSFVGDNIVSFLINLVGFASKSEVRASAKSIVAAKFCEDGNIIIDGIVDTDGRRKGKSSATEQDTHFVINASVVDVKVGFSI